ncbi:MAG: FecR domain-containing protein [Leptospirales bacterium]|nr:FecR domain-containing protein [Leptospirales bacterium]
MNGLLVEVKERKPMRMRLKSVAFAGLILSLAVGAAALNCGKNDSQTAERSMIIVFASGEAVVVRGQNEMQAKVGMVVNENDTIKTTNGTVDLQTRSGSAVRIKNFTTVTIAKLYGEGSADTRLSMQHGSLMASVKRTSGSENFSVTTPTAIAGVRGTTFTVDAVEGESPRVRVLDGRVAVSPRIAALENLSQDQINGDQNLRNMQQIAQQHEVVVEDNSEATLDPRVNQGVLAANERLESAEAGQLNTAAPAANQQLQAALQVQAAVHVEQAPVSADEMAERATLITVDSEIVGRLASGDQSAVEDLRRDRDEKQEVVLNQIEQQASQTQLNNEQEIRQHYNRLETLNLKDGTQLTGAVIAQTGAVLVVHTPNGVKRVNTSQVESITYP